ncbi:MAG: hypothetical protein CO108_15955 [Deltaproteobacteria bacterium CG_4_9_14_3_um_filter_63_12]|nr:MAG: hypothetical protein COW42_11570 [Deltaproteobacteria bacterium CG17_big_fil_post_rev_8_21_14_2_50_63_7]PJB39938.1 MAG: hypothetical protein CO108_15955 [Deltaproteobacteria bacterium CG_4_9_14_3_um_filter_63_12]
MRINGLSDGFVGEGAIDLDVFGLVGAFGLVGLVGLVGLIGLVGLVGAFGAFLGLRGTVSRPFGVALFVYIVSGCGCVGLFRLVVIRPSRGFLFVCHRQSAVLTACVNPRPCPRPQAAPRYQLSPVCWTQQRGATGSSNEPSASHQHPETKFVGKSLAPGRLLSMCGTALDTAKARRNTARAAPLLETQ